jgi:hypothetical protein
MITRYPMISASPECRHLWLADSRASFGDRRSDILGTTWATTAAVTNVRCPGRVRSVVLPKSEPNVSLLKESELILPLLPWKTWKKFNDTVTVTVTGNLLNTKALTLVSRLLNNETEAFATGGKRLRELIAGKKEGFYSTCNSAAYASYKSNYVACK